ncbi:unnamed protein product [Cylicocyclus nassatus]|uniref:Ion transport domain-containing protein n=1 Tax=Cylicocyclus nassatus TaxID=53992 RepID=A0AA36M9H9_CYLNA|nr:unnamed protein product [Cylicocyclus nassatus]
MMAPATESNRQSSFRNRSRITRSTSYTDGNMNDGKYTSIPLFDFSDEQLKASPYPEKISIAESEKEDPLYANYKSIFHQNARDGDVKAIEELLNKCPKLVDAYDCDGMTSLHYASKYGHPKVVELLLKRGANVNVTADEFRGFGYAPLHMVAKYGRLARKPNSKRKDRKVSRVLDSSVRQYHSLPESDDIPDDIDSSTAIINLLVKYGADVDITDTSELTPMHHAAQKNNEMGARALIKNNAEINKTDKNGVSPLMLACIHGSAALVHLLLSGGADCTRMDNRDNTVYHAAAFSGKNDTLQLLIRFGEDLQGMLYRANKDGKTPLLLAVDRNHSSTVAIILPLMPKDRPDIDEIHKWMLHTAASKGYRDVCKTLIENGYDPRLRDDEMKLPLHHAAKENSADVVRYLLELAPDTIDESDQYGFTPFLQAVAMNALEAVKVLVERGANIFLIDCDGRTAIMIGSKYNAVKVLLYLIDIYKRQEADEGDSCPSMIDQVDHEQMSPMHYVCNNGYMEVVTLLHDSGASIDVLNEDEATPLHLAANTGQTACVRQLLEWDKKLVLYRDENAWTALHFAASNGHDVTAKVLIDAGSDVNARNSQGKTPLDLAVEGDHYDTVNVLLEKGAVIESANDDRCTTPLHVAAEKGYDRIVERLLWEASPVKKNENGETALDLAISNGHESVARVLVDSSYWEDVMAPTDTKQMSRHSETRTTPMRQLIDKFPKVAEVVFDKCIELQEQPTSPLKFKCYYFKYLDDTYMMPSKDGTELTAEIDPYDEDGRLKREAKAYSDDYDVVYKYHPLKMMANAEKLKLLSHPLVIALIKHKWNSLGRYVYYLALMVYIVFMALFTLFITYTPAPFNVYDADKDAMVDFSAYLYARNATCEEVRVVRKNWLIDIKWAVIGLAVAQLVKELFQLVTRRLRYLSLDNAIECFVYSSAIIVVSDISPCSEKTGLRMNWQWYLAAVCAFLCWMNLLLLIRKLPRFGIYVVMFFDILRTFSRFFIIFVLFVVAFSIAFFVIMQNRPEFSTVPSAVLKTAVMMIGELEFTAIFHGDMHVHPERLFGPELAYPLFLFFCVIMTILLMNLLVGLAVDDIKGVQDKAELKRLSMQVDLVLQVEASMPYIRKLTTRSHYSTQLGLVSWWKKLRTRFGFNYTEKEEDLDTIDKNDFAYDIQLSLESMFKQLHQLQENIDNLYERQVRTEAMVRKVLEHNKIDYEEVDSDKPTR